MKNINTISLLVIVLVFSACNTDELTDLNRNPNTIDYVIPEYLFTQIELNMPYQHIDLHAGMQYIASVRDVGDIGGKQYDYIGGFGFDIYSNQFNAIKQCIDALQAPEDVNRIALCRIIRAYGYHMLTDAMGDVPYSEANEALDGLLTPKYDTQQAIYADMLHELDEAASSLDASYPTFGSADVIYNGDLGKWRKFAYTLMLRLAMRLSDVDEEMARTYAQRAIAGGIMTESDDVAYLVYNAVSPNPRAPYTEYQATQDPDNAQGRKLASTLINQFKNTRDPRIYVLSVVWTYNGSEYIPDTTMANQKGLVPGSIVGVPSNFSTYSEYSPIWWNRETSPLVILGPGEAQLLLAEAVLRGWYTGTTEKAAYDLAVTRAMQQWALWPNVPSLSPNNSTISVQSITSYLTSGYPYLSEGTFEERLEQISIQKWLCLLGDDYEVWSNWRRTGYPDFNYRNWNGNQPYPGSVTGGEMFRRLPYPDERATNNENQQEALARQGFPLDPSVRAQSDALLGRVWWDMP